MVAVHACHGPGKSKIAARICCWWLGAHEAGDAFIITTAPSEHQVKGILWREIKREFNAASGKLPGNCYTTHWDIGGELVAIGRKPGDLDMTAFQGYHAKKLLIVLDEGCGISSSLFTAAETLITSEDSRLLVIGNPDDQATEFGRACKAGSGFKVIGISAYDTPNFTGESVPDDLRKLLVTPTWVNERKTRWGETSPLYISKVLGQFPEMADDALFSQSWLRAAVARELQPDPNDCVLGVDVARFGIDKTQIYVRRGRVVRRHSTGTQRDLMYVTGMVMRAIDEERPSRVYIDDAGLGGGVTDRLNELMRERRAGRLQGFITLIVPINAGSAPGEGEDGEKFINLRGQLHWNLAQIYRQGQIDTDDDEDLQAQLGAIKYTLNSKGQIIIEPKADMKKRGLPSPDNADAVMLAFTPPGININMPMQISDSVVDSIRKWARA